jgi:uncharacterized protein
MPIEMPIDLLIVTSALLTGLFGSTHCALMCGGIAAGLSSTCKSPRELWFFHAGRVVAYSASGALASGVAQFVVGLMQWPQLGTYLRALAGVLLLFIALRIAGLGAKTFAKDPLAFGFWRALEPVRRRLLSDRSGWAKLGIGAVWGWLPCGLSMTMLKVAVLRADVYEGALMMFFFGIGTLPLMHTIMRTGSRFTASAKPKLAASLLALAGVMTLAMPWLQTRPELHALLRGLGCGV